MLEIKTIVGYLRSGVKKFEVKSVVDGKTYNMIAHKVAYQNANGEILELLSSFSTKGHDVLAEKIEDIFRQHVEKLVREKVPFYTSLRNNWGTPVFHWELK